MIYDETAALRHMLAEFRQMLADEQVAHAESRAKIAQLEAAFNSIGEDENAEDSRP